MDYWVTQNCVVFGGGSCRRGVSNISALRNWCWNQIPLRWSPGHSSWSFLLLCCRNCFLILFIVPNITFPSLEEKRLPSLSSSSGCISLSHYTFVFMKYLIIFSKNYLSFGYLSKRYFLVQPRSYGPQARAIKWTSVIFTMTKIRQVNYCDGCWVGHNNV